MQLRPPPLHHGPTLHQRRSDDVVPAAKGLRSGRISGWLILIIATGMIYSCAQAETLAIICMDPTATTAANCKSGQYDWPGPTDRVRKGTAWPFTLAAFSTLNGPDMLDTCQMTGIARGTPWIGAGSAGDPCKGPWGLVPASTFKGTSGITITLSWEHDGKNVDDTPAALTGFWIWSAAAGAELGRLQQIDGTARSTKLTGYGPGVYQFAMSALSADGESALSSTATHTIIKPVGALPSAPGKPSIVEIKIE